MYSVIWVSSEKWAAAVERGKVLQARGAEPGADRGNVVELDGVAQRIAQRPAEQAAMDAGLGGRTSAGFIAHAGKFTCPPDLSRTL